MILGNTEMYYVSFGEGKKKLVVLPGLSDGLTTVKGKAWLLSLPYRKFFRDYTVYMFSRKNDMPEGYSIEDMAEDQVSAMRSIGFEQAYVMGVSQGGMIAQYMAIRYPELVQKLVLGSSTSKAEPLQITTIQNWARLARAHDATALVNAFIDDCFSEKFAARYRRALLALYKEISDEELDRFALFADACDYVDTYNDLGKIKCQTLVLGAGKDRVTTPEASIKMAEKLKAEGVPCESYMYEGCGHAVFDELPDYKQRIFDFLEK